MGFGESKRMGRHPKTNKNGSRYHVVGWKRQSVRDGESYTEAQRKQRRNAPASPGPTLLWASGISHPPVGCWCFLASGNGKPGNPAIQSCRASSQAQNSMKDGSGGLIREQPVQLSSSIVKVQHIAMSALEKGSQ